MFVFLRSAYKGPNGISCKRTNNTVESNQLLRVLQEKTHYSTKVCFKLYHSRKTTKNAASFVLAHLCG